MSTSASSEPSDERVVVTWRGSARLIVGALMLVLAALGVWAWSKPGSDAVVPALLAWALSAMLAAMLAESLAFRLVVDDAGLLIRSLGSRRNASWDELVDVRLVHTHADSRYIYHERTQDPEAAQHVILQTRGWTMNLHRWTHDLSDLERVLRARGWLPSAPGEIDE